MTLADKLVKHASPVHPGTGTDQSVHGGGAKPTKTYYHLTDDPNFELRDIKPTENYLAISYNDEAGIYLTDDPERWVNGYGYLRPFIVELELEGETEDLGRWGGEHFVRSADFDQLKIKRVIPLDEYAREHYNDYGWIEGSLDEGAVGVGNIPTFPDYQYTGPDVRNLSPEEVERHKQRAREAWVVRGHGTEEEAKDLFKHASPVHPGTGTDQSVHGGGKGIGPRPDRSFADISQDLFGTDFDSLTDTQKDTVFDTSRTERNTWTHNIRRALSLGTLTPDEAHELGYWGMGHDQSGTGWGKHSLTWQPLPEQLYHVTVAGDQVVASGLKSREELNMNRGIGLGGGESDTISFATDLETAKAIHDSMKEARKVATGEIGVIDLMEEARRDGYLDKIIHGWDPKWTEGQPLPVGVQRILDSNNREDRFEFYKRFSTWREATTGQLDPLFFSSDVEALSRVDPSQIQLLEFRPKPGAQGYPLGGLREWRTASGEAVELVEVIAKHAWGIVKHSGPGPHPGTGTPQSVHGSGSSVSISTPNDRPGIDDNPTFRRLATELHSRASALEPEISATFQSVASETGGQLVGYEFRLKSESSIRDKIFRNIREAKELRGLTLTPEQAAADIRDLNRYSFTWPADEHWVGRHVRAVDLLRAQGWEVYDHKYKSAWAEGDHYDGTNVQLHRGDDFVEVQFHTPESWDIKERSDKIYAEARILGPGEQRAAMVEDIFTLWNADRSHVPPGAAAIGNPTQFLMKGSTRAVNYVYLDPEGNPVARVRVVGDRVQVFRDGSFVDTSLDPADVAGHGGRADFQPLRDFIVKHAGPGSHPGTGTPQEVHGGGTATLKPLRDIKIKFVDGAGRVGPAMKSWIKKLTRQGVEAFNREFPDYLPDEVVVVFHNEGPDEQPDASAWVEPGLYPNTLFINASEFTDLDSAFITLTYPPYAGAAVRMAQDHRRGDESPDAWKERIEVYRKGVIMHELAHVSSAQVGWHTNNWPEDIPAYTQRWYPIQVNIDDPSLPSAYAVQHPGEYFAEALIDTYHRGEDATPLSKKTRELFDEIVAERQK